MNAFHLELLHAGVLKARSAYRDALLGMLIDILPAAREVARQFDANEAYSLLEVHRRLPWRDLIATDVRAAGADAEATDVPAAYSQQLAGRLEYLAFVGSDAQFTLPGGTQVLDQAFASSLADRVCRLSPEHAVALSVILEAAQAVSPAALAYDHWWHPDLLRRLLASPEHDLPIDL